MSSRSIWAADKNVLYKIAVLVVERNYMRRNFAQVLQEGKIDIRNEYSKLYAMFYGKDSSGNSVAKIISDSFTDYYFRGTCLSLDEFNTVYGFNFEAYPVDVSVEYLVDFCEYIFNLVVCNQDVFAQINKFLFISQIDKVIESIGYMKADNSQFVIFVPKDSVAVAVSKSEYIPKDISYKVIAYNHHSMKGNLEGKKETLLKLADILEAKRAKLSKVTESGVEKDLFFLLNNCNIRHNNRDINLKGKYHRFIAEISGGEQERIYDEIYQMCLLAFMQLEHADRKDWLDDLKYKIVNDK